MVQYWYDAWGNHKVVSANGTAITSSTHIGNVNPFRYRGYYYDTETDLYFLQTRYYDPEVGRFLNRDSVQYADPQTLGGLNLYAYCLNNPVEYKSCNYSPINNYGLSDIYTLNNPYINSNERLKLFNSIIASGSFKSELFFGEGTLSSIYASGNARAQISLKSSKIVLGAFGKLSLLNGVGQVGIGNTNFNLSLIGVADIGTISGMGGLVIDPVKNNYFIGVEAKASVLTARGGIQFEIFGTEIEMGGSVNALSVGVQFGFGIKDGEFYYRSGFAFLFGYDFYIRIKFA